MCNIRININILKAWKVWRKTNDKLQWDENFYAGIKGEKHYHEYDQTVRINKCESQNYTIRVKR